MEYVIEATEEFDEWLAGLSDQDARGRINARILRAEMGNLGATKSVGDKVAEMILDFGPGYRLYYWKRGRTIFLLLCGGDKSTQKKDIKRAMVIQQKVEANPK